MMKYRMLFLVLLLSLGFSAPAQGHNGTPCRKHTKIKHWKDEARLRAEGFYPQNNASGTMTFQRDHLALNLETTTAAVYSSARVSDINTDLPVAERTKCWEPTEQADVVLEATLRFDTAVVPPGLTENQLLWNAPFSRTDPSQSRPVTSFGVTRNSAFGGPNYHAIMTMDFDFRNPAGASLFVFKPIAAVAPWLNPTAWHTVRIVVGATHARVEVEQAGNHATILEADLPHAPGPLGSVFSVDNEVAPGLVFPVVARDGLDLATLEIAYVKP